MRKLLIVGLLGLLVSCEGKQGPAGQSIVGPKGDTGAPSVDGKSGDKGEDGKNGTDGAIGDTGPQGKDGIDGVDGKDGTNGKDGDVGPQGEAGADGKDGSSCTTYMLSNQAVISCTDGSISYVDNGVEVSIIEVGSSNNYPEVVIKIGDVCVGSFSDDTTGTNTRLAILIPGVTYLSTDSSGTLFEFTCESL